MIRRKYMIKKHIQIAKVCIKKAKGSQNKKRWIKLAEQQVHNAKNMIKTL